MASAIDEGYLPFALVVANSIAQTKGRRRPVEYHVLYCGPPEHWAVPKLEAFQRRGLRVIVHQLTNPWAHLGVINDFPAVTFFRTMIPDVLAGHRRALYVDVDLVVEADLGELFDANLGSNPIGATQCVLTVTAALKQGRSRSSGSWMPTDAYFEQELELVTREQKLNYMQCGVQLFDLERLRAMGYGNKIGAIAEEMRDRLAFVDQCATNKLLSGQIALLDSRWNISPFALNEKHEGRVPPELVPVLRNQRRARGIIHFGGQKPWRHPLMPGSWRWWRYAFGSGAFRYIVDRERPHWRNEFLAVLPQRHPRLHGLARSVWRGQRRVRDGFAWLRPRLINLVRDPLGTARRIVRRLRGLNPDL